MNETEKNYISSTERVENVQRINIQALRGYDPVLNTQLQFCHMKTRHGCVHHSNFVDIEI
jgi:hypothetical protein